MTLRTFLTPISISAVTFCCGLFAYALGSNFYLASRGGALSSISEVRILTSHNLPAETEKPRSFADVIPKSSERNEIPFSPGGEYGAFNTKGKRDYRYSVSIRRIFPYIHQSVEGDQAVSTGYIYANDLFVCVGSYMQQKYLFRNKNRQRRKIHIRWAFH